MKVTLQDILSIEKSTWLDFIKKHMSVDHIKLMEDFNDNWRNLAFEGHQEIDKYRVFTFEHIADGKPPKSMFINFYKDMLFIDTSGTSDCYCEYYADQMMDFPEAGLQELMKVITQLAIVAYNLDAGEPIMIGVQVAVMLAHLME